MNRAFCFFLLIFCSAILQGQEEKLPQVPDSIPSSIDSLYREDQFYIGFTFNLITNRPSSISQKSFSGGLHLGFTRDFPVNKRRNVAIGAGLGWSINSYGQNLLIDKSSAGNGVFQRLEDDRNYSTNRFSTQLIEAPLEFRWRTSTPETYKFWRIYSGLRLGYIYYFRSNFVEANNQIKVTDIPELNRFRIGATFTFGYNTFNFHFYYGLNPFFKNASLNGVDVGLSTLKMGLMFYIL